MPGPSRVLIADDHEVVRHGLRALLQGREGWEICGEAKDGREAVEKALQLKPDVAVLDIGMPNLNGLEAARQILHHQPQTAILILTIDESEQLIREVIAAGALGFMLKSCAGTDLVTALEALRRRRTFFTSPAAVRALSTDVRDGNPGLPLLPRNQLTPREREIVQLLAEGNTTKKAAAVLGMSVKTAETHRSNIMRKLHFHSVSQLVMYAVRNNLIRVSDTALHSN